MKTIIKRITNITLVLLTVIIMSAGAVLASTDLEDGNYTIDARAVNESTGEPSMADGSIIRPITLEVKNNQIHVLIEMTSSMYDLSVKNSSGEFVLAEEVSENIEEKTITYTFPVENLSEPVSVEVVVAAMGRKVGFNLVFDDTTLVLIDLNEDITSTPSSADLSNEDITSTPSSADLSNNEDDTDSSMSTSPGDRLLYNIMIATPLLMLLIAYCCSYKFIERNKI